jgi:hypothetical protein
MIQIQCNANNCKPLPFNALSLQGTCPAGSSYRVFLLPIHPLAAFHACHPA